MSTDVMDFINDSKGLELLNALNNQRSEGTFCDVRLRSDEDVVCGHRCVLAASSEYFRNLFKSGFQDSSAEEYNMPPGSSLAVDIIVSYMYTGHIRITLENVDDILKIADFLCMNDVKGFCSDLLRSNLDLKSCIHMKALVDQFGLNDLCSDVTEFLTPRMAELLSDPSTLDLPYDYIYPLLSDQQLTYIDEQIIYDFTIDWLQHNEDRMPYKCALMQLINFDYVSPSFVRNNVSTSQSVMDALNAGQKKTVGIKLSEEMFPSRTEGVIICRSRVLNISDEVKLLVYWINENKWYTMDTCPEGHLLDDLESMTIHQGSLYLLLTLKEDMANCLHESKCDKQLWKVDLTKGTWTQMAAPNNLTGQSRLIPHVRGLYAIDRTGIIEKFDNMNAQWMKYNDAGFTECPNATMMILPMPMDRIIYILRGYSEGYSFEYSQMTYSLYRYDTGIYTWDKLAEIEAGDIDLAEKEQFHGYTATTTKIYLKNALGFPCVEYDLIRNICTSISPMATIPSFITEIWGSAENGCKVFFTGRMIHEKPVLMFYDHAKKRFKMTATPPVHITGLMCSAAVPRSFKNTLSDAC